MAISPPSDLVLDVVRAADPAKVRQAHRNLLEKGASSAQSTFELAADRPIGAKINVNDNATIPQGYRDFEAMVLQTFIQNMLPKDTTNIFGEGTAGDMWKGMMAEKLGEVLAEGGGIGIARQLAEDAERAQAATAPDDEPGRNVNFANRLVQHIQMGVLRETAMSPEEPGSNQEAGQST